MTQSTPSEALAHLSRLASKPEVRATLILSRSDGVIVHSSGLTSTTSPPEDPSASRNRIEDAQNDGTEPALERGTAEEIARMVFDLVNAAGVLAGGVAAIGGAGSEGVRRERVLDHAAGSGTGEREGTDSGIDDVQLLRVRTRKGEAVVVPDAKFLHVVIHDGPKAT